MITDNMIRDAAIRSRKIFADKLESNYDSEHQHEPSPDFKRKIEKLQRRADHPLLYRPLCRIASIVLVLLISGGTLLAANVQARAAFFGWVKEIYETYFVYRFENSAGSDSVSSDYRPTWLPDGYTESSVDLTGSTVAIVYTNAEGQILTFQYTSSLDEIDWFVDIEQVQIKSTTINGNPAEILIAEDAGNANGIMWTVDNERAYYISAFLSESELIQMAESVQQIK